MGSKQDTSTDHSGGGAMSIEQTARYLAISPRSVRYAISTGALRARKMGARVLVTPADADAYIASLPEAAAQ